VLAYIGYNAEPGSISDPLLGPKPA
jgi:hypothetical protein